MGKRNRDQYDYENAFASYLKELDGMFVEEMIKNRIGLHYATKTIKSGRMFEVEIYPVFKSRGDIPRVKLDNRKAQNDLNERNSRKRFIRLVNANFGEGDYWITLTYADGCYPGTEDEARRNLTNYIKRVNRRRRKYGLGNARYIYIMEWDVQAEGTRCHYHILMEGGICRDELEDMWRFAVVNDTSRIHLDEDGIGGLAAYMADKRRWKKGKRRWTPSKNLKQPKERVSHSRTGKRQVERMVRDYEEIRAYFEKEKDWKRYRFDSAEVMYNKFNCAFYIRIKARERSWENEGTKKKGSTGGGIHALHCRTVCDGGRDGEQGDEPPYGGGKPRDTFPCGGNTGRKHGRKG